jgi:hypothetical protein
MHLGLIQISLDMPWQLLTTGAFIVPMRVNATIMVIPFEAMHEIHDTFGLEPSSATLLALQLVGGFLVGFGKSE